MVKRLFSVFFFLFNIHLVVASSPILSNFRIDDSNRSRVYFDSDEAIIGSSANGFTISGKTISGITIASGQTTGHYFTVTAAFTLWDNNTIRYEGGSDIQDSETNSLDHFPLVYIQNDIQQPTGVTEKYVSVSGSGNHDGSSEANAYTFSEMQSNIDSDYAAASSNGLRYNIKAGNYGQVNLQVLNKTYSATKPLIFEGYQSVVGDNPQLNWTYSPTISNIPVDGNLMPLIDGGNASGVRGMQIYRSDYIIIKNLQIVNNPAYNIVINGGSNLRFENIHLDNSNNNFENVNRPSKVSVRNSSALNGYLGNFGMSGDGNLIKDSRSYCNYNGNATDYYFVIDGSNSILINCITYRENGLTNHTGHGCSIQTPTNIGSNVDPNTTEYNLVDGLTAVNQGKAFELRHPGVKHNVVRNVTAYSSNPNDRETGGFMIRDGSSHNIVENVFVYDANQFMIFFDSTETGIGFGHDNIIRNCVGYNIAQFVQVTGLNQSGNNSNNKFYNNTFINGTYLWRNPNNFSSGFTNTEFKNNIFSGVISLYNGYNFTGVAFDNNNFHNGFNATGSNQHTYDPKFVNPAARDFKLNGDSELIDKGLNNLDVNFDFDQKPRPQGGGTDIGAYEFVNPFLGSLSPDFDLCEGETTTLIASGGTSYLWNSGETTATLAVTPTATTTYSVTITDANDITETLSVTVTVEPAPAVDAGLDQTICEGDSITLTATGEGDFLWSNGETTASITVSPTTTTTYSVTASNSCSTDATDEVVVNVDANVNLDAGADVSICEGESVTLTATGTGEFTWSTGETTASISVSPSSTTTYSVTATNGTCSESDEVIVSVEAPPTVDAGSDQTICEGESVTLTAVGNGNFLWSTGETTASITVNPTTTTTYSVTASNSCSTDATDEVIVNVDPSVNLNAGADISICQGESATLTATGTGPFVWSTGETTASITVNPTATTTYTVTSTNGTCSETDDLVVSVNTPATVNAGADQTICEGESITLTASGNGNFLWSTGETTESITVSPTSTTTYSVTVSNACNTDATDEVIVTVNPGVTLDAGPDLSICSGESIELTAVGTGPFNWSTGETTASITVSPSSTTTYTVISDNGNCSLTDEVIVTVNTSPTVNAGSDRAICQGESVTLTATGDGDFTWSTGETTASITVSPDETTTYSVTSISQGCQSTAVDYVDVVVSESPNLSTTSDMTIQQGETVTLNATGNGDFVWSTGETTSSITVSPLVTTSYTVTLTTDGGCSEKNTITVTVTAAIDSGAVVAYAGEDITICSGNEIILTASGGDDYLWSTGETERSIRVTPDESTIYSVRVTKGDYSDTAYVKVTIDGSCNTAAKEMVIYPNPTDGILNVALTNFEDNSQLYLYSQSGSMLLQQDIHNEESLAKTNHTLDLSRFRKGVYFLRVVNKGASKSKKVILK